MNETLRRALLNAGLNEVDVAARLEVDPKTVRRWLEGRLPYTRYRWALAGLLNLNETDLWPELRGAQPRPAEVRAIYPHRSSIPRDTWRSLFASAEHEISVLAQNSLFLAEDADIIRIFAEKASSNVRIRIALRDPNRPHVRAPDPQEDTRATTVDKIRSALALYEPLRNMGRIEIRLHSAPPYSSTFRSDDQLLCKQHAFGIPAADCPVLHLQRQGDGGMAEIYIESFDRLWNTGCRQL